jgi:hypothetical protein
LLTFASFSFTVYAPALDGGFISDDRVYVSESPYTDSLDRDAVVGMFAPFADASAYTANYAPVHLLLHAVQRQAFADATFGYHVTNVLLHALNATLLLALLLGSSVPPLAALWGASFFALHPANVEAVAWISQLKSVAAMTLALMALLVHRRWPLGSTLPFALALLTKASASFALPLAAGLAWARGGPTLRHGLALGAWTFALGIYLVPQFGAHGYALEVEVAAYDDPFVQLRSMAAYGARYLAMAVGYGIAPFQQPGAARSLLDPWWLAALPLGPIGAWRIVVALRARSEEGAWWLAAAAAFAPVSQWLPFGSGVADRYLYFILPGLIGGALLLGSHLLGERVRSARFPWLRIAQAAGTMVLLVFGVRSHDQAAFWQSEQRLLAEGARIDSSTMYALHLSGLRAMRSGDVDGAVAALEASIERGMDPRKIWSDGDLAPLRGTPAFVELVRASLEDWLERQRRLGRTSRPHLAGMARVELGLGRPERAIALFERALSADGPYEQSVRAELEMLRAMGPSAIVRPQ